MGTGKPWCLYQLLLTVDLRANSPVQITCLNRLSNSAESALTSQTITCHVRSQLHLWLKTQIIHWLWLGLSKKVILAWNNRTLFTKRKFYKISLNPEKLNQICMSTVHSRNLLTVNLNLKRGSAHQIEIFKVSPLTWRTIIFFLATLQAIIDEVDIQNSKPAGITLGVINEH